jgi:hypothetical protein
MKRVPTPREHQLSMQDLACVSQHQPRCEESNPRVQDPACRQKQSFNMYMTYLYYSTCMYATCLYCNTRMYMTSSIVILRTPSKTRVSETSNSRPFRPLLPISHPPVTCHYNQPITAQPVPSPTTKKSISSNNLCIFLMHTPSHNIDIPQELPNHNNHTKNVSSIHHTMRKSISQHNI